MDGITAALVGALAGAVIIIAIRTITDIYASFIAMVIIAILIYFKKVQEPYIILVAAVLILLIKTNI